MRPSRSPVRRLPPLLAIVLAGLSGCEHFTAPRPTEGLLTLRTLLDSSVAILPADGYSRVTLVASIDKDAAADKRTIVFTTTKGALFTTGAAAAAGTAANLQRAEVVADAAGRAYVDLQSVATVGEGRVDATVSTLASAGQSMRVVFQAVVPDSVIRFESSSLTIDADGFSVKPITIRIGANIPSGSRTVRFETTAGTFASGTPASVADVAVDASNIATILYRSRAQAGEGIVRATVAGVTRELSVTLRPVSRDSIIRVAGAAAPIDADGATVTTVAVWVASRVPEASRSVTLTLTSGTLVASTTGGSTATVTVGQDDSAHVDIKSPITAGTAHLRATVGAFTQDLPLVFRPALPDTILLDAGRFTMKPADTTIVTAQLIRAVGTVTRNTFVAFGASDSTGTRVGQFRSVMPTGDGGQATAVYSAPEVTTRTVVTLRASLPDGSRATTFTLVIAP